MRGVAIHSEHHPVAVLIPCFNEEGTIGKVVRDFRRALPTAQIHVYDNNSTDRTAERARAAGAVVRRERHQGKGHVVRRMFADIDADVYVLVDGDDTYDAGSAPHMVELLTDEGLDMVSAARVAEARAAYRLGHRLGNRLFTNIVRSAFGRGFSDILSGYRVLSRRFVKSFPGLSNGFEIETELTVHALELHLPAAEVATRYGERPDGSISKLRTLPDGLRVLWTIAALLKEERPFQFFTVISLAFAALSVGLAWPVLVTYWDTGLVPRFPTAILSTGVMLLAFLAATCGLILETVTRGRRELKRLHYLATPVHQVKSSATTRRARSSG